MIPLWWGLAVAADPTYERLFGAEAAPGAAVEEPGSGFPTWIWPASLLGLGLVAATRLKRSVLSTAPGTTLRIVDRQALGSSTLLVVEVEDGTGERRRLLIGTGTGAPALVADLGSLPTEPEPAAPPSRAEFAVRLAEEVLAERGGERIALPDPLTPPEPENGRPKPRYFTDEDLAPVEDFPQGTASVRMYRSSRYSASDLANK